MERRNLTYSELALKLEKQGYGDNAGSLTSRINRGTFTLAFALRVLDALGVHELKWAEEPQRSWTTRRKDRSEREDGSGS
ncbi:MAG: hypothetical protein KGL90_00745 [Burkholderiales bacterium]|nr:hypothetical protein [Burkholderiales bacterium]